MYHPPNPEHSPNPQGPPPQYPQQPMSPQYQQGYPGPPMQPPQYPMRPPYYHGPPPKKKSRRGLIIGIVIAVIVFAIMANVTKSITDSASSAKATKEASQPTQAAQSTKAQPTPTPKPEDKIYQLGEYMSVKDGDIEWTVGGSEAAIDPGPVTELDEAGFHEYTAQPGNVFLVVKLAMQNTGEKSQEVRNDMWELQGKDGHTYPSLSDVSYTDVASVFPTKRLDAELVYEIPAGQKAFRLLFRLKEGSKPIVWEFAV